jgi:hypothetical protein
MSRHTSDDTSRRRPDLYWVLVTLFTLIVCAPLAYPGYFELHSGFLPVFNLYNLERQGLSLTWAPVVGLFFDVLRGDGLFPYMLALLPRRLGASGVDAVKVVFALSLLLGPLGMYGWTRRLLDRRGALLAAVVYACWPYALATVYVRGAFAEALLLGLLPWALWAQQRLLDGFWTLPLLVISAASLVATQPGLAFWALATLLVYGLSVRRSAWPLLVCSIGGGLLVGAVGPWTLATIMGMGDSPILFGDHFVYLFQLFSAAWGRGVSIPGWQDDFPLRIGLVCTALSALAVLLLAAGRKGRPSATEADAEQHPQDQLARALWTSLAIVAVPVALSLTWSAPLWRLPGLAQASRSLTYPWQLLSVTGPFLALLSGSAATFLLQRARRSWRLPLWAALVGLTLLASYSYLAPQTTQVVPEAKPLAVFGEKEILLLDAHIDGQLERGQTVQVVVHWQPLRPVAKDYTVFVHAVDPSGNQQGQQDTQPLSGQYPTSRWQVGEVIEDTYEVDISPRGPLQGHVLHLGLYDWQTGERMPTRTDDKVMLGAPK